jgi:cyclase
MSDAIPAPRMQKVSDGIYTYLQLDGSWGLNNPGVVVGSKRAVVIDSLFTRQRNLAFREALATVCSVPVRILVNTHHHGDHVWGNALFPEAAIVAHEKCRTETIETGLSTQALFPGVDFGEIEIEPAFITFEDRLSIHVDDLELELIYLGPAHTTNDVAVWIPERRVLFAGDLVFNQCTPFVVQGSLAGHITAVERLRELRPETVVPGHGAVCGPEVFKDTLDYLAFLKDTAARTLRAGLSPLEAARTTDLGRFGNWHESERIVANLHRAYSELRGEPLGTALPLTEGIFAEMVEFNGGPLRCFA